jgi:hypothetical protein
VVLSWTASTDAAANPTLTYNVYKFSGVCTTTGSPVFTKINTAPVTTLTYTDSTVTTGTFCYYVTAVLNGAESAPSTQVSAVILLAAPTLLKVTSSS